MDNELKELLKINIDLSEKNNAMLTKLVRAQKRALIYRIIYWAILIFSALGLFYFLKPYASSLFNVYSGGVSDFSQIQNLFDSLK
ncbi:MAG: hypothetical protein V4665_04370 [Patescibacteria group bacterium]